jgi:hypothetical protein
MAEELSTPINPATIVVIAILAMRLSRFDFGMCMSLCSFTRPMLRRSTLQIQYTSQCSAVRGFRWARGLERREATPSKMRRGARPVHKELKPWG